MAFREKSAWISFLTMLAVFGVYFGAIFTGRIESRGIGTLHYLLISVIAVIVLQVVLQIVARLLARGDAGTPKDERERLIELKAIRIAYVVLMTSVLLGVTFVIHGGLIRPGPPELALTVLAAVVLADLAKSAATIAQYRLGA